MNNGYWEIAKCLKSEFIILKSEIALDHGQQSAVLTMPLPRRCHIERSEISLF